MGHFTAQELENREFGVPGIKLVYRLNEYDRAPRIVYLLKRLQLRDYDRRPFSYEFQPANEARNFASIRVIAAPGVSVLFEGFPPLRPGHAYVATPEIPALEVIRVQDPELVPPMARDLSPEWLLLPQEINSPLPGMIYGIPVAWSPELGTSPNDYFLVVPKPDGVIFRHPASEAALVLTVIPYTHDRDRSWIDSEARFAYVFHKDGVFPAAQRRKPLLEIVRTPQVNIELAEEGSSVQRP